MTTAVEIPSEPMTVEEFYAWAERQPRGRFELVRGEVIAMAPERVRHALTKHRVARVIEDAVAASKLDCIVLPNGVSVKVDKTTNYEPDAIVQCGAKVDFDSVKVDEPLIVVEVLSPTTQRVDLSGKLVDYFRLPSVRHYLIIDAVKRVLIHHRRDTDTDTDTDTDIQTRILSNGPLRLDPPGLELMVEELFVEE